MEQATPGDVEQGSDGPDRDGRELGELRTRPVYGAVMSEGGRLKGGLEQRRQRQRENKGRRRRAEWARRRREERRAEGNG